MSECQCLNQKLDYIVSTIESMKKSLKKENVPIPENLNLEGAIVYLNGFGCPISKSAIYKLTSRNSIPVNRFGRRLVFVKRELENWVTSKLSSSNNDEMKHIFNSATKKLTKKSIRYGK